MTTISGASNWLADAWASVQSSSSSYGMLGALDGARKADGSIKSFLESSANAGDAFALIAQNNASNAGNLTAQIAAQRIQQEFADKLEEALSAAEPPSPPKQLLDPIIFFENGSTLDTQSNILTLSNGTQLDALTGARYFDPSSIVTMANGAYLDTKNNILTLPDGTRIDTVTGLLVSTTA
jgi:hypothetical protein